MAEQIVSIGLELQTQQLAAGIRQTIGAFGQLEKAEKDVQRETRQVGQESDKTGAHLRGMASDSGQATQAMRDMGNQMKGAIAGWVSFHTAVAVASASIKAALNQQALTALFTQVAGSTKLAAQEMLFARQAAERLGFSVQDLSKQYAQFVAASKGTALEGERAKEVFLAIVEAGRALQLSNEQVSNALNAVQQMMAKGKITAEEWRGQLGEALPIANQVMATALGVSTEKLADMLEQGELTIDMLSRFAQVMRGQVGGTVTEAANSAGVAFTNLNTAITDLAGAFGETLLPTLKDLATELTTLIRDSKEWATNLGDFLAPVLRTIAGLAVEIVGNFTIMGKSIAAIGILATGDLKGYQIAVDDIAEAHQRLENTLKRLGQAGKQIRMAPFLGRGGAGGGGAGATGGRGTEAYSKASPEVKQAITQAAAYYGIPLAEALTLFDIESGFDPRAANPRSSARGLGQLITGTARAMGVTDPFDTWQNAYGSMRYYAEQRRAARGDPIMAYARYKAGPGAVAQYGGVPPDQENQEAVRKFVTRLPLYGGAMMETPAMQDPDVYRKNLREKAQADEEYARDTVQAYRKQQEAVEDLEEAKRKEGETFQSIAKRSDQDDERALQMIEQLNEAVDQYTQTQKQRLNVEIDRLALTPERDAEARAAIQRFDDMEKYEARLEAWGRTSKLPSTFERIQEEIEQTKQLGQDMLHTLSNEIEHFAMTGEFSFKRLGQAIAGMLAQFAMSQLTKPDNLHAAWGWAQRFLGLIGPGVSPESAAGLEGEGALFGATLGTRQHGGPVARGRPYLVGERGPEFFVPRSSGTVVPNHAISGNVTNVTFHISTPDAAGLVRSRSEVQRAMLQALHGAMRSA